MHSVVVHHARGPICSQSICSTCLFDEITPLCHPSYEMMSVFTGVLLDALHDIQSHMASGCQPPSPAIRLTHSSY